MGLFGDESDQEGDGANAQDQIFGEKCKIIVKKAVNLKNAVRFGTVDPYCEVTFQNHTKKTKVADDTKNPEWNEELEFPRANTDQVKVQVKVFHEETLGKDKLLGYGTGSISGYTKSEWHEVDIKLIDSKQKATEGVVSLSVGGGGGQDGGGDDEEYADEEEAGEEESCDTDSEQDVGKYSHPSSRQSSQRSSQKASQRSSQKSSHKSPVPQPKCDSDKEERGGFFARLLDSSSDDEPVKSKEKKKKKKDKSKEKKIKEKKKEEKSSDGEGIFSGFIAKVAGKSSDSDSQQNNPQQSAASKAKVKSDSDKEEKGGFFSRLMDSSSDDETKHKKKKKKSSDGGGIFSGFSKKKDKKESEVL